MTKLEHKSGRGAEWDSDKPGSRELCECRQAVSLSAQLAGRLAVTLGTRGRRTASALVCTKKTIVESSTEHQQTDFSAAKGVITEQYLTSQRPLGRGQSAQASPPTAHLLISHKGSSSESSLRATATKV